MANRNNFREYRSKKKGFNLYEIFSGGIDGKGVKKQDRITDFNLINFFKLYGRYFGRTVQLNLLYILGNFPILFYLFARSGNVSVESLAPTHILNPAFSGILLGNQSPVTAALNGILGYKAINYVPTPATYVMLALAALVIFTFGFVNVGTAYIMRNMVKQEPIFFMSDFFYAIRRNWRQALVFGILDVLFCALLVYDVMFFYYNIGVNFIANVGFYLSLFLIVLYFIMRFYIYPMMVTFQLSIFKILKNALIFALLGFKRNLTAVIGMVLFCLLCYAVLLIYIPLGLLTPFLLIFGTCSFMAMYAAFPKIKEIMIDPYYTEPENNEDDDFEPVFRDRG
ncbi:MAG: DUF624 domain-containing protein [Clostridia bacterium]|nr:DUF624 domain-containing protein [Clostridia bacterium]